MSLLIFHRVLIVASIGFDVFFTLFCVRKYNVTGDAWELVMAGASSLLTVGLIVYLIYFNKKTRAIRLLMAARDRMCPECQYDLRGSLASDAGGPASAAGRCPECGWIITDTFRAKAREAGEPQAAPNA